MARLLDRLIVVDLEATCWRDKTPPEGEVSDIIEIGVAVLDMKSLERVDKRAYLVRPERSSVSSFCTELTSLKPEDVADAPTLANTCADLAKRYRTRDRVWASWGDYDRKQMDKSCAALGVRYPFSSTHINLKSLYALWGARGREVGMARALEEQGLTLEGTHHRGVDDAWNIAALAAKVFGAARE